jgi:hypothetical protein
VRHAESIDVQSVSQKRQVLVVCPPPVTEACLVTTEYLAGAELVPFGQRVGGRVIHRPLVVRTSSPCMSTCV